MTLARRSVLAGCSAVATAGLLSAGCSGGERRPTGTSTTTPLNGALASPPPLHAVVAALDLEVSGPGPVADAARRIAERVDATRASVLIGLGASLFERAGLVDRRPRQLATMPRFPGDVLDPQRCHGDLLVEVGAASAEDAGKAFDGIVGDLPMRWRMAGFRDGVRVDAGRPLSTNLFGFIEGHGNPAADSVADVVRVGPGQGEPAWATGGSYQVVRIIQFATALWNKDPVEEQERIIGRRRDGRWLDGTAATGEPAFAADPNERDTPLDAHVRRANPRTGPPPPLLRRGYSYRGKDAAGRDESGLLFIAYQRNLAEGFEAVQRRLAGERLGRYVLTVGGGYFFVPPSAPGAWWGSALFAA
jgi:deferrochelatase/peroxidase EfeB